MANTYENMALDNSIGSDGEYQAYIQAVEAAMLASGFLEVAPDTGQINPLTVTRPASGVWSGYRIYRAKDSLAGARPLYTKVEYGISGNSSLAASIRRQTATGTNGAGTLTGPNSSLMTLQPNTPGGVAQVLGGGGPHAAIISFLDPGGTSNHLCWGLGRCCDQADGSPSNEILWDMFSSSASVAFAVSSGFFWTDGTAAWATLSNGGLGFGPDLSQSINSGGNVSINKLFPGMIYRNGKVLVFPWVYGKSSELPFTTVADSKFSFILWGGNHTFLTVPISYVTGAVRAAMLWE